MDRIAEAVVPMLAIVFTFGIPGVIIFWALYIKHKERTKLMDMGLTPQEARDYFKETERRPRNPYSTLKWGILLTMIGLGLFIGIILEEAGFKDSLTGVTVLLFGGIGFIIYYIIVSSKMKKDDAAKQINSQQNTPQN